MFITFGIISVVLLNKYWSHEKKMKLLWLLREHLLKASVIVRRKNGDVDFVKAAKRFIVGTSSPNWDEKIICTKGEKEILLATPVINISLDDWTAYLDQQDYSCLPSSNVPNRCHVLLQLFQQESLKSSSNCRKRIKITDYAVPIAWHAGMPFNIVASTTVEKLAQLAEVFFKDPVFVDDMLEIYQLASVNLVGQARHLLHDSSLQNKSVSSIQSDEVTRPSSWENLATGPIEEEDSCIKSNESLASSSPQASHLLDLDLGYPSHMLSDISDGCIGDDGDGLMSYGDSGDGYMCEEGGGGEALSPSIEEVAPEILTPIHRRGVNQAKPPNVLVYCGKKDTMRQFETIKHLLQHILNKNKYVIYNLKHEDVLTAPWTENTVLLIISSDKVYDGVDKVFFKYVHDSGGTVISFSSGFDNLFGLSRIQTGNNSSVLSLSYKHWQDVTVICGRHMYSSTECSMSDMTVNSLAGDRNTGLHVILEVCHDQSGGVALLSQVNLDKDPAEMAISPEVFAALKRSNTSRCAILSDLLTRLGMDCDPVDPPDVTPYFLFSTVKGKKQQFLDSVLPRLKDNWLWSKDLSLLFIKSSENMYSDPSVDKVPVITEPTQSDLNDCDFNMETYSQFLNTQVLGQVVFYANVVTTTMKLFDSLIYSTPPDVGMVAIAKYQLSGKGRRRRSPSGRTGNAWLSPEGCAMFSLHVRVPLKSLMGQGVAFLQHIASLAVVQAVTDRPGYEDLELYLKWPNDIYFGSSLKIGGVIVNSSIMRDVIHCNIGCGFNVGNKDPTICINDLVRRQNQACGTRLPLFTTEDLIASTINQIEKLVNQFQEEGPEPFKKLYYDRWLHHGAVVRLGSDSGPEVLVVGLDTHGYLSVKMPDGSQTSVHPDGNSFDMMRNLIVPKR